MTVVLKFPKRPATEPQRDDAELSFEEKLNLLDPANQRALLAILRARFPMHRRDPAMADFLNGLARWIEQRSSGAVS
jgi:hypothetical protein